jgi:hypothetical protein
MSGARDLFFGWSLGWCFGWLFGRVAGRVPLRGGAPAPAAAGR